MKNRILDNGHKSYGNQNNNNQSNINSIPKDGVSKSILPIDYAQEEVILCRYGSRDFSLCLSDIAIGGLLCNVPAIMVMSSREEISDSVSNDSRSDVNMHNHNDSKDSKLNLDMDEHRKDALPVFKSIYFILLILIIIFVEQNNLQHTTRRYVIIITVIILHDFFTLYTFSQEICASYDVFYCVLCLHYYISFIY